jgi:hypothetical protein
MINALFGRSAHPDVRRLPQNLDPLRGEEVSSIMIAWRAAVRAEPGGRLNTPLRPIARPRAASWARPCLAAAASPRGIGKLEAINMSLHRRSVLRLPIIGVVLAVPLVGALADDASLPIPVSFKVGFSITRWTARAAGMRLRRKRRLGSTKTSGGLATNPPGTRGRRR